MERQCSRRRFFAATAGGAIVGAAGLRQARALGDEASTEAAHLPRPTAAQLAWQDCELAVVYHFTMTVFNPQGARYAYFTPTHMNGFLQWQSDLYPYGVRQSSWRNGKGDVVQDFVQSCRRYGIEPCLFFGTRFNGYWDVWSHVVAGGDKDEQAERLTNMLDEWRQDAAARMPVARTSPTRDE